MREAFKNRSEGDYEPFVEFTKEDVADYMQNMKDFILKIESLLKE